MYEQEHDHLATPAEACREYAANVGADHPDRAWILTDFDTWEQNPFYHGPAVPHPEDESQYEDEGNECEECGTVAHLKHLQGSWRCPTCYDKEMVILTALLEQIKKTHPAKPDESSSGV